MVQKMMVDRAQRGDKNSFAFVIQQIQDESYRIANSYLLDEAASMDAVCDAVEEAVSKRKLITRSSCLNRAVEGGCNIPSDCPVISFAYAANESM
ncbi:hypothetical protein ABN764_04085 [Paenibacillaceae sp. P-4]|uniref:hypothetical protein n=1 Tax=Paenibacillaceae bacterium P-4 TaxID=3160969 RepID=UPI0032E82866